MLATSDPEGHRQAIADHESDKSALAHLSIAELEMIQDGMRLRAEVEVLTARQDDLSLLVVRMARRLRNVPCGKAHMLGNQNLADQAITYLQRHKMLRHPIDK